MNDAIKLSIKEILGLKIFDSSEILTGEAQVGKRINRVNIVVDPDIDQFVEPGELLLSTSFFFKSMTVDKQIEFIQMLSNKGVACLGIKFSPHLEHLSPGVIEHARKLSFVIFTIDYKQSFTDLISRIYETIFDRQIEVLNKISKIHNRAMELLSEGGDIYDIIRTLEEASGSHVLIIDNYYDQIYCDQNLENRDDYIKSVSAFRNNHRTSPIVRGELKSVTIRNQIYQRYIFPMYVKNETYGYIVTFMEESQYLDVKQQLIESVSTVASLYFYNQLSVEEVEMSYRSEFLENLLLDDQSKVRKALDRAVFFNMNPEDDYQIVRFQISDVGQEGHDVFKYLHKIKSMVDTFEQPHVLAIINNQINLLYRVQTGFKGQLIKRIEHLKLADEIDRIIFGRVVHELASAFKSFEDCNKISNHPELLKEKSIVEYEQIGIYRLLIEEKLGDEIRIYFAMHLETLVEYDQKRSTNLVDTLRAYFSCNGNLRKMSDVLFTHYNTILYRIERIEAITGKKLENEEDRFNLHTSLKIYEMIDEKIAD